MNETELRARFPNASDGFIRRNLGKPAGGATPSWPIGPCQKCGEPCIGALCELCAAKTQPKAAPVAVCTPAKPKTPAIAARRAGTGVPADCLPTPASRSAMLLTSLACKPSADEAKLNRLERAYLALLRANAAYAWVGVQCVTLKLGDDCRYSPDFVTIGVGGEAWAHECKGFMRDDALVKLKVAARKFPWINFCLATRKGGVWTVKPISP